MQRSDYLYQVEMGTLIFLANKNYNGPVCELHDNNYIYQEESGFSFHTNLDEAVAEAGRYVHNAGYNNTYAIVKSMNQEPIYSIGNLNGKVITDFVGKRWSDAPAREITELDYIISKRAELREEAEKKEREEESEILL